jgi:HSP20 family protein
MTVMATWDLFEDLRAAQDEMARMNRARAWRNGQHHEGVTGSTAWVPPVDISEREDAYLVAAELPGVRAGDVEITFQDGLLTIQGERHDVSAADGQKVHRAERRYGPFRRSITLPNHVDADKIEASAQDGVLQVLVPKAKDVRANDVGSDSPRLQ